MKKIILIIVVIILFAAYRLISSSPPNTSAPPLSFKSPKEMRATIAAIAPVPVTNFTASGRLLSDLIFSYNKSDFQIGRANLLINFRSLCDYGQGEQICREDRLTKGMKVYVEGNQKNDTDITVIKLKVLE